MAHHFLLLAQASSPGGAFGTLLLPLGIILIMYFLMIRPQQKQMKEHRALLSALKKGDDVVTQGGVFGKIYALTDKVVTLEVANGVRIRVLKSSIQGRTNLGDEQATALAGAKVDEKKEEK